MQTEPARTNEWLGKEEVAELLDKSIRTILNLTKKKTPQGVWTAHTRNLAVAYGLNNVAAQIHKGQLK